MRLFGICEVLLFVFSSLTDSLLEDLEKSKSADFNKSSSWNLDICAVDSGRVCCHRLGSLHDCNASASQGYRADGNVRERNA